MSIEKRMHEMMNEISSTECHVVATDVFDTQGLTMVKSLYDENISPAHLVLERLLDYLEDDTERIFRASQIINHIEFLQKEKRLHRG